MDCYLLKCLKVCCEAAFHGPCQGKDSGHCMGSIAAIPVLKITPVAFGVKKQRLGPKIIMAQRSELLRME